MKYTVSILFLISLLFGNMLQAKEYKANTPNKNAPLLKERFPNIKKENYQVSVYKGKIAKDISDKKHIVRTRLRQALKDAQADRKNIDFAGHYLLVGYGCGVDCFSFNIVDVKTGQIFDGFSGLSGYTDNEQWVPFDLQYTPDSTLLYMQGNIDGTGSFVYEFKNGAFQLLEHSPVVSLDEE